MTPTLGRLDDGEQRNHQEATLRSIDQTRDSVRSAIDEAAKETPRFAQTITDFRNETHEATKEVVDTYLESQKQIMISMHSSWSDVADKYGYSKDANLPWNYWWSPMAEMVSPIAFVNLYARMVAHMAVNFAIGARIFSNMTFATTEAARASTKYARDHSREISRMVTINAKVISHTTKEAAHVENESAGANLAIRGLAATNDERNSGRGEISGQTRRRQ